MGATAYKTCYDVYNARYAAYNGTKGSTITNDSAKAAYDAGSLLVTKSLANNGLQALYDSAKSTADAKQKLYTDAKAAYDAQVKEHDAQKAIAVQAGEDVSATTKAATAASDKVGDATK